MTEIVVLAIVVVIVVIYFKMRKKSHKCPEHAIPEKENKPASKPLDVAPKKEPSPQAKEPSHPAQAENRPVAASKTDKTVTLPSDNLPQDSMLRRHYLANLRAMVEALNPPHPTDSALSRHYDALITSELAQCLNDKGAIERLIGKYESHKKTMAQPVLNPKNPAEPLIKAKVSSEEPVAQIESPKLPEDSTLRRHMITHLKAIAESNK